MQIQEVLVRSSFPLILVKYTSFEIKLFNYFKKESNYCNHESGLKNLIWQIIFDNIKGLFVNSNWNFISILL